MFMAEITRGTGSTQEQEYWKEVRGSHRNKANGLEEEAVAAADCCERRAGRVVFTAASLRVEKLITGPFAVFTHDLHTQVASVRVQ